LDIREAHPELVFWRLNGQKTSTATGREERIGLLRLNGITRIDERLGWRERESGKMT
jgi:hypothetical protein